MRPDRSRSPVSRHQFIPDCLPPGNEAPANRHHFARAPRCDKDSTEAGLGVCAVRGQQTYPHGADGVGAVARSRFARLSSPFTQLCNFFFVVGMRLRRIVGM